MPLYFHNATASTAYLAAVTFDPNCGPNDKWRKGGWWAINPGTTFEFTSADLRTVNRYMAWHADTGIGTPSWTNDPNRWYHVSEAAFNQCYDDETNCTAWYDFAQLDFENRYGLTVTLLDRQVVNLTYFDPPPPPPPPPHDDSWSGGDDDDDSDDDSDDSDDSDEG